jgi:hypothetical protein
MNPIKIKLFILLSFILISMGMKAQVPQGINYQGLAANSTGSILSNQAVSLRIGIYSPSVTGTLEWQETHNVVTNQFGILYLVIGQGASTGAGSQSSFASVNWGSGPHFIRIAMDESGGTSYTDIDTIQFWSVPYAMHSARTDSLSQVMKISELSDVDTSGLQPGSVLKWNGFNWTAGTDNNSDTALFAVNAGHSINSDTAAYSLNTLSVIDTVPFSYNSDTSVYSQNSGSSEYASNSNYCDTAVYAINTGNSNTYWNLLGNAGTNPAINYLGTSDNKDLIFKTNNIERVRVTSAGRVGIGIAAPVASLHLVGNDGFSAQGTFGSGVLPPAGAGTRMVWHPKKASFRAGGVSSNQWDDVKTGIYSFASGFNTTASGAYSSAFGSGSTASGAYSLAACELSTASGTSSVSMGNACIASGAYSVALGRGSQATDSSAVAMGYHPSATGKYAVSIGYTTMASGDYSVVMGYAANSNNKRGSFVYADASSNIPTNSTADNQFMARASGGFVLYTNAGLTTGVTLAAGSGSWSSVSDKNKKEHFKKVNAENILTGLKSLEISSWNYKTQSASIRHIGPFAQDFYHLFKFGESDTTISTVDMDGISLAAIQALTKRTEELKKKSEEVEELKALVTKLENEKRGLEKRVVRIEQIMKESGQVTATLKN